MAMKKEELAKVNTGELQVSGLLLDQLEGLKSDGFENVTAEDLSLPILNILQSISPQCDKKNKDAYDPDVQEGQFYNSVTKKSTDKLTVIPIGFTKAYVEWTPRSAGGGFVGRYSAGHPRISQAKASGNKLLLENGNELVEAREHYLMIVPEDGSRPYVALLPLKATQVKNSKRFVNEMTSKTIPTPSGGAVRAPMFFQKYELSTGVESNQHGSWYGLTNITYLGLIDDELVGIAKEAAESFNLTVDKAQASYDTLTPAADSTVDAVTAAME